TRCAPRSWRWRSWSPSFLRTRWWGRWPRWGGCCLPSCARPARAGWPPLPPGWRGPPGCATRARNAEGGGAGGRGTSSEDAAQGAAATVSQSGLEHRLHHAADELPADLFAAVVHRVLGRPREVLGPAAGCGTNHHLHLGLLDLEEALTVAAKEVVQPA